VSEGGRQVLQCSGEGESRCAPFLCRAANGTSSMSLAVIRTMIRHVIRVCHAVQHANDSVAYV